jgi:hypothetical protein
MKEASTKLPVDQQQQSVSMCVSSEHLYNERIIKRQHTIAEDNDYGQILYGGSCAYLLLD